MDALTAHGHLAMVTFFRESVTLVRLIRGGPGGPPAGRRERIIPLDTITHIELDPPSLLRRGTLTLRLTGPLGAEAEPETVRFSRSQQAGVQRFAEALRRSMALTAGR